jgi:hypothetical protein
MFIIHIPAMFGKEYKNSGRYCHYFTGRDTEDNAYILPLVNGFYLTLVQEIGHLCVRIEFPKHFTVI